MLSRLKHHKCEQKSFHEVNEEKVFHLEFFLRNNAHDDKEDAVDDGREKLKNTFATDMNVSFICLG